MRQEAFVEIRSLSRKLKLLVLLIGLVAEGVLIYCAWRLSFDFELFTQDIGRALLDNPAPISFTPIAVTGLIVIGLANAAIVFGGLHAVWSLFNRYEIGDLFSRQCGKLLRRASMFALAGAVSGIVSRTAAVLLVTYSSPTGQKMLSIGVSSTELFLFLLSGLLFVLGHIMMVAEELEADYRSFV